MPESAGTDVSRLTIKNIAIGRGFAIFSTVGLEATGTVEGVVYHLDCDWSVAAIIDESGEVHTITPGLYVVVDSTNRGAPTDQQGPTRVYGAPPLL